MKSHHPILPGGSCLLGMKSRARGGGFLNSDLVLSIGCLMTLSACPCLRLPHCEMKIHSPVSRSCVRQEKGTLEMDTQGHVWKVDVEMTAMCSRTALGPHSWTICREQADLGFIASRKVLMKESKNVAAKPREADGARACSPRRERLNRLWLCLGRRVKEGNDVIFSACADGRNYLEFTSGQARRCSIATPFSLCKYYDAIGQNQILLARHCRVLFQLLPTLLQRDHVQMTDQAHSSLSLAFLCCSTVPISCIS